MAQVIVTGPKAAQTFRKGSWIDITWELIDATSTSQNLTITLKNSSGTVETIETNWHYRERPIYRYRLPANLADGTDYYIHIVTADTLASDSSATFTVTDRFVITDFPNLTEIKKSILVEIKAGTVLSSTGWTAWGSNRYYIDIVCPEIVSIKENGVDYIRNFQQSGFGVGHYFHDVTNKRLYIRTFSDTKPDDITGLRLIASIWLGFTNSNSGGNVVSFKPEGSIYDIFYQPFLDGSSIPAITQKVADYYTGSVTTQFGSIRFLNDGWWWEYKDTYLWHNRDCFVKVGELGCPYDEYVTIFPGHTRQPLWSDQAVTIDLEDQRSGALKDIPVNKLTTASYANVDKHDLNQAEPILFGVKTNIVPPCIDTTTHTYLVSQTVFAGGTYALQSIDAVYLDGVRIYLTTNYTVNLTAGTITLLNDPGDQVVTVDAHGIKCGYDFTTGAASGTFSENTADILYFVLTELNGISVDLIDLDSFAALQTKRTQRLGWYLGKSTKTAEFIKVLQASTLFHFLPTIHGGFMVRYYDRDTPTDALRFYNADYTGFDLVQETSAAFKNIVLQYDKDPTKDTWKPLEYTTDDTGYKHNEEATLTVKTALVDATEAANLMQFYAALVADPAEKITTTVTPYALQSVPSDKVYISRSIINQDGREIVIRTDEVYLILEAQKDVNRGLVRLQMIRDTQAQGIGSYADIPHGDDHADDHTDDHTDSAHTDVPHVDIAYVDDHDDVAYVDHNDGQYNDDHDDVDYGDYIDYALPKPFHIDNPYEDHNDGAYSDHHHDVAYTDEYTDTPHYDTPHGDGYNDDYVDEYTDEHTDIPHVDSVT